MDENLILCEELFNTIKWIPKNERKSKWYLEYLDKVNYNLKQLNK